MGWIFLSIVVFSGIPWACFIGYTYLLEMRKKDPKYTIVAIAQKTPLQGSLKTAFLAELFDLSIDQPTNLYTFDLAEATYRLLHFPCIEEASIKRIPPGIIAVDYELRNPVAFLADYSNTAIDAEGYTFPFHPFYSPKKLPSVFLGIEDPIKWGERVDCTFAFPLLDSIKDPLQVDISQAESSSLGDQKIIVRFEGHEILLDPLHFKEGLARYQALKSRLSLDKAMIDLRLPKLGFIQKEEK